MAARRTGALGEFLRARRDRVAPGDVGLVSGPDRQVHGLRREEVALLAGVSTDYYVRLEQGRERRPSPQVVRALSDVLRLDRDARRHLQALADQRADPHLEDRDDDVVPAGLLDHWTGLPAMAVNHVLDVVGRNSAADALYRGLPFRDNLARMTFYGGAAVRAFVADWEQFADCVVATLRGATTGGGDADALAALTAELSLRSEPFRTRWGRHDVHRKVSSEKYIWHPRAGLLALRLHVLALPAQPLSQVWVYEPLPGSEAAVATLTAR